MSLTANKIASEVKITQYDFDPNTTDATAVAWVDMKDFSKFIDLLLAKGTHGFGGHARRISAGSPQIGDLVC